MNDNKLIAKFMELPTEIMGAKEVVYGMNHDDWYTADNLNYHLSWDWLMPVVGKISRDEKFLDNDYRENLLDVVPYGRIEDVFDAVVLFINQYNKTK
jgi:hypothetical protein